MWYHVTIFVLMCVASQTNGDEPFQLNDLYATSEGRRLKSNVDENVPSVSSMSGASLTFHCIVEVSSQMKDAEPVFDWFHDGERIGNLSRFTASLGKTGSDQRVHAKLRITKLEPSDAGLFSCVVSKEDGPDMKVTWNINLIVIPYDANRPILKPFNQTITSGTNVNLTCVIQTEDYSIWDAKFFHGHQELDSPKLIEINSTAICIIVQPDVTSRYFCKIGDTFSNPAHIYITQGTTPITNDTTTNQTTTLTTPMTTKDTSIPVTSMKTTTTITTKDTTTPVTNKKTTNPKTTEDTTISVTTDKTTSHITTEDTITSLTTKDTATPVTTKNITTPVTTKKSTPLTTEKTITPITTKKTTSRITTENTTTSVTTKDTATPVITKNITTPVKTEKSTPVTTEKTTTPIPTEKSTTPVTTKKMTPVTTEKTTTPVNTEKTTIPVTTEKTTTPVTTEKTTTPITTEKTTTPITTEKTTTHITTEKTTTPITTEKTTTHITTEKTTSHITTEDTNTSVTTKDTTTPVTTEKTTHVTTEKTTTPITIKNTTIPITIQDSIPATTQGTTTSVTTEATRASVTIEPTTSITTQTKTTIRPTVSEVTTITHSTSDVPTITPVTSEVNNTTPETSDAIKITTVNSDITNTTPVTSEVTKTTHVTTVSHKDTTKTATTQITTTKKTTITTPETWSSNTNKDKTTTTTPNTGLPITNKDNTPNTTPETTASITHTDKTTIIPSNTTAPINTNDTRSTTTREPVTDATTTFVQKRTSAKTQTTTADDKTRRTSTTRSTAKPAVSLCEAGFGPNGIMWEKTMTGQTRRLPCPTQYEGEASRYCSEDGSWRRPDMTGCRSKTLLSMSKEMADMKKDPNEVLQDVSRFVKNSTMVSGDLHLTMLILQDAVQSMNMSNKSQPVNTTDMLDSIDNMLNVDSNEWMDLSRVNKSGVAQLMLISEDIVLLVSRRLKHDMEFDSDGQPNNTVKSFKGKNIYVEYGRMKPGSLEFPVSASTDLSRSSWVGEIKSLLPPILFDAALSGSEFFGYGGIIYRNISRLVTQKRQEWKPGHTASWIVNSPVLSLSLEPKPTKQLSKPFLISFKHSNANLSRPVCSYLSFDAPFQLNGRWSSAGCSVVRTSESMTLCQCNHLTNFAILMSPTSSIEGDHGYVLSLISLVGCAISVICLCLTILSYVCLWRYVKSDPAVLLLNLCTALIISYGLFVFGVSLTDNQIVCTVVAALLHYFYLAVFAFMLAEGIEVLLGVTTVFKVTSRLPRLLSLGWGGPLLIVGFSMGFTQMEGYGNEKFCWLSLESGLLWAFVGPALGVITINAVIVVVVLKAMFRESTTDKKSSFDKARTGLRAICVLMPVMGLTWVFGVFSVNKDLVVFQYLFAVCNSLQGLFIFIFHCFSSKQIRTGMKSKIRRYQAHKWNSSGSKYFSNTASQRYPNKLASKKSNASQKVKLSNHSSVPVGGDVTTVSANTFAAKELDCYNSSYDHSAMMRNNFDDRTFSNGLVNPAFTYFEDDVFYANQNDVPDLRVLKTTPLESAPDTDYNSMDLGQHNTYNIQVLNPVSNVVVLDKPSCNTRTEECHMMCTPVNRSHDITNPVIYPYQPNHERQSTTRLNQRRDIGDLPKLVMPVPIGQHSCRSPSNISPPSAQSDKVRRRLPSGNVRFNDEEKISTDLEQKLKARRKRLDQIYGVIEAIWPNNRQQDNTSSTGRDEENKKHNSHLSALQHINARVNWSKLKSLFLRRRSSDSYVFDHEWFSTPTPSDMSMHGTFRPFRGITLPSTQFHSLSWEENSPEWSSVHFDVFPSLNHT